MTKHDIVEFEILPDGSVKMSTDKIGPANHAAAERLQANIAKLLGGPTETIRKREGPPHARTNTIMR
jgi:hypothetical protein